MLLADTRAHLAGRPVPGRILTPAAEDEMALLSLYVPPGVDSGALEGDTCVEVVGALRRPGR